MGFVNINYLFLLLYFIKDNGGIREAWGAYKKHLAKTGGNEQHRLPGLGNFSADQLFFMSYGNLWCESKTIEALAGQLISDAHSPAAVRVRAVLSNMQQFQDIKTFIEPKMFSFYG